MSGAVLAAALGSLALMAALGLWAAGRTRTASDFFIAGQRLGLWVTGLGTMSAAFSGFVFLGGPGLTYRIGVASLFIVLPVGFTAGLLCWVVAGPLRRLAGDGDVFTLTDVLARRYAGPWPAALGALATVVGTVGYLGSQLLALGLVLEAVLGTAGPLGAWSLPAALGAGALVVLFYSAAGGMVAGAYTDLAQGLLMLAAAVGVFVWALGAAGGPAAIVGAVSADARFAGFFEPFGRIGPAAALGFFWVFGLGVLGQPQMLHKFFMLRDPRQLRWMPLVLGGSQAVCLLVWVGLGLAAPAFVAQGRLAPLERPDEASLAVLLGFAPPLLAGLAVAGGLAAIMSTADSFLNIGSAALVRDLPRLLGRRLADELRWGRMATVGLAVAAAVLALAYGDLIALLGTFAFGILGASLAPALAVGLNWERVGPGAAAASIGTGLGLTLLLELVARRGGFVALAEALPGLAPIGGAGVPPAALALAASFTVLMVATWAGGRRPSAGPTAGEPR